MTFTADSTTADLQRLARDHLWLHFTRMGGYAQAEVPIIVRGDGCYLEDCERQALPRRARRALLGQPRLRVRRGDRPGGARADARAALLHELVVLAPARDRARRRARLARARRPEPRLLRLRRLGGGRVGLEARAPVLPRARRQARHRPRTRGTTSASARHLPASTRRSRAASPTTARPSAPSRSTASRRSGDPFEPLVPEVRHVRNTNRYHRPPEETEEEFTALLLDDLETTILAMGPETVCLVHMEPVQNAGGALHAARRLLARRARALRPLRHPALRRRGDHRLRPRRPLVRVGALRHPAGHRLLREGPLVLLRRDRRGDRDRPCDGAVPRRLGDVRARDHLRRPSGHVARSRSRTSRS